MASSSVDPVVTVYNYSSTNQLLELDLLNWYNGTLSRVVNFILDLVILILPIYHHIAASNI